MTFGAMATGQAWALLAAAAAIATWLFFLRVNPPRVVVPSLLLWRRALDESRALSWWERARQVVSFLIVIVTTLALALAIVRPSRRPAARVEAGLATGPGAAGTTSPSGRILIVIDSSWSMLARTRTGDTRWDRAVAQARALTAAAGGQDIALATTAEGLVEGPTSDAALIDAALDRLRASGGETSAWPRLAGVEVVHFITDGAVARRLDPGVMIHSVFDPAPNVAITAFDVRPSWQGETIGDAYLEVANYAEAQTVHVVLTRGAATVFDRRLDMAAGEAIREIVPLGRDGDPRLRARVDAPNDALVVDDEAVAWIRRAQPLAVTVVSDQPAAFALLLQRDPDVRATFVRPAGYRPGDEDVVIFDRWLPPGPTARPALCVAPPSSSWLGAVGTEEQSPRWTAEGSHPVLRGVDPLTVVIARARAYGGAELVPVARSDQGTPLVYVADSFQRRLVLLTFGTGESNLSFAPAFPVLVGNALEWLARPESGGVRRPGLAFFDVSVSSLVAPDGQAVTLTRVGDSTAGMLRTPGFYVAEAGGSRSVVAVNIGDPEQSNLMRTSVAASGPADRPSPSASSRPWWLVCAALGFGLLAIEWWTWQRRITV